MCRKPATSTPATTMMTPLATPTFTPMPTPKMLPSPSCSTSFVSSPSMHTRSPSSHSNPNTPHLTNTSSSTTTTVPSTPNAITVTASSDVKSGSGKSGEKKITRKRTGCLKCRQRKKKCDEEKPVCRACVRNRFVCTWPDPNETMVKKERRRSGKGRKKSKDGEDQSSSTFTPNGDESEGDMIVVKTEGGDSWSGHDHQIKHEFDTDADADVDLGYSDFCCSFDAYTPVSATSTRGNSFSSNMAYPLPTPTSPMGANPFSNAPCFDVDPAIYSVGSTPVFDGHFNGVVDAPIACGGMMMPEMEWTAPPAAAPPSAFVKSQDQHPLLNTPTAQYLLSHYTTRLASSLSTSHSNPFITTLLPLANCSLPVMLAVLALSSSHLANVTPSSPAVVRVAEHYHGVALSALQSALRDYTAGTHGQAGDATPLAAVTLLLALTELVRGSSSMESTMMVQHLRGAKELLVAVIAQPRRDESTDFLLELYAFLASLSTLVLPDHSSIPQDLEDTSDPISPALGQLLSSGYTGALVGLALQIHMLVPRIARLSQRCRAELLPSHAHSAAAGGNLSVEALGEYLALQRALTGWMVPAGSESEHAAAELWRRAALVWLHEALTPASTYASGSEAMGSVIPFAGAIAGSLSASLRACSASLSQFAPTDATPLTIAWPLGVLATSASARKGEWWEMREVAREKLSAVERLSGMRGLSSVYSDPLERTVGDFTMIKQESRDFMADEPAVGMGIVMPMAFGEPVWA